jgi:hypothetical protein
MSQELPLMRKATAVWLVENTALTFKQIAQFCGLHDLEVQGIADGDVASGIVGQSPVISGQLTKDEIAKCEADSSLSLKISQNAANSIKFKTKTSKYTPIARRQDKPDGILFLLKYYPEITNSQIKKLIGTTDKMIDSIRDRSHWNIKNIKSRDVVLLGLCSQSQFNATIESVQNNLLKEKEVAVKKAAKKAPKKATVKKTATKK